MGLSEQERDIELEETAKSFKFNWRPFRNALIINACILLVFLVFPFIRGYVRAVRIRPEFAKFAACFYGGSPLDSPGLAFPKGDREQFADQFLYGKENWPIRCIGLLHNLAPDSAFLLWPMVRQAESDLRAAVQMVERELRDLVAARKNRSSAISLRPLQAISRLRAALSMLATATWSEGTIYADAIEFTHRPTIIVPAEVPISTTSQAQLTLSGGTDGIDAVGLDSRAISWVNVAKGQVEQHKLHRPNLLHSIVNGIDRLYLVWAMPRKRCRKKKDRCAYHATGIAPFDPAMSELPKHVLLRSHPAARFDKAFRLLSDTQLDILSLKDASGVVEVRRFLLPQQKENNSIPLSPVRAWSVGKEQAPVDATLLAGQQGGVLYAVVKDGLVEVNLKTMESSPNEYKLLSTEGESAWVASCYNSTQWLAYGSESALRVSCLDQEGIAHRIGDSSMKFSHPFHQDNPALDDIRFLCTKKTSLIVAKVADSEQLMLLECDKISGCKPAVSLVQHTRFFDAIYHKDHLIIAYSNNPDGEQIHVIQFDRNGSPNKNIQTPAACWQSGTGMCGLPRLVSTKGRLLLVAQNDGYLFVIESVDGGQSWDMMSGLRISEE